VNQGGDFNEVLSLLYVSTNVSSLFVPLQNNIDLNT